MTTEVIVTPITEIKAVIDVLADLGLDPLHLHVDGHVPTDQRPSISMWIRYRTDFFRVCEAFAVTPRERPFTQHGARSWFAESDSVTRCLLVQCVSFEHHHDWEPREVSS